MSAYRRIPVGQMVVATLVLNSVIAIVFTAFGPTSFAHNMVFSQCIGLMTYALIDLPRRRLWPLGPPALLPMFALVIGASLAGWLGGSVLGGLLLGIPGQPNALGNHAAIGFIVLTVAAGFAGTAFFWTRERIAATERMAAEARLKLLTAQIEPHFLFNTLANLQALIATDPSRAQSMLAHLDRYLRSTLAATRADAATLGDEFALLKAYLEIIAIRMGERLRFDLDLPPALAGVSLPPMLLQPLVENAVRHGIEPKITGGRVSVRARMEEDQLLIVVEDDGLGVADAGTGTAGGGVGIANVRERLTAAFGPAASATIEGIAAGGTRVTLRLPQGNAPK